MKDLDKMEERRTKARQRADKIDTEFNVEKAKQEDFARQEIGLKTLEIIEALPGSVRDGYVAHLAPTLSKLALKKLVTLGYLDQKKADRILEDREAQRKSKKPAAKGNAAADITEDTTGK